MNKISLYQELDQKLQSNSKSQKIKLAMEYLNQAAQLLENMQAAKASEVIVAMMEKISKG